MHEVTRQEAKSGLNDFREGGEQASREEGAGARSSELPGALRHRREWKSFATNFNVNTSSKSTDSGGPDLTSNPHAETPAAITSVSPGRGREEGGESRCVLQRMLFTTFFPGSLTSLASGWQFRPWHMEPVRFTKGSALSHQLSAG